MIKLPVPWARFPQFLSVSVVSISRTFTIYLNYIKYHLLQIYLGLKFRPAFELNPELLKWQKRENGEIRDTVVENSWKPKMIDKEVIGEGNNGRDIKQSCVT